MRRPVDSKTLAILLLLPLAAVPQQTGIVRQGDRFVRDFETGYTPDDIAKARGYLGNLNFDHMMHDIAAAQGDLKGVGALGVTGLWAVLFPDLRRADGLD